MADCSVEDLCISIVFSSPAKLCLLMDIEIFLVSVIALKVTFNWESRSFKTDATLVSRSVDHQ